MLEGRAARAAGVVGLALAAYAAGVWTHRARTFPYSLIRAAYGRVVSEDASGAPSPWQRVARARRGRSATSAATPEDLKAFPYSQGSGPAPRASGVETADLGRVAAGATLYTSGDAPEAYLIDVAGRPLHRWRLSVEAVWPNIALAEPESTYAKYWRTAALREDGGLVAIFDYVGMIEIDRESRLIWASSCQCHHDLDPMPDGSIYTLTAASTVRRAGAREVPVVEDFIAHLDAKGVVVERVSVLDALEQSDYRSLRGAGNLEGDLLHTNSLQMLPPEVAPRFNARGRAALVSFAALNAVAVVDLDARRVTWALAGLSTHQHSARIVAPGVLLLFDNGGNGVGGPSQAIEVETATQQVRWRWAGEGVGGLSSDRLGEVQRLSNGNTLVVESVNARAFEVTPDGRVVWQFVSPHTAGAHGELVANLFHVHRYETGSPELAWLPGGRESFFQGKSP